MFSRVILFGAGASYGAGGIAPSAPPLGPQLFEELARSYPLAWGALPPDAKARFASNFEAGMAWVWTNLPQAPQQLHRALGHFFAKYSLVQTDSAYFRLIAGIAPRFSPSALLATLNYDLLLEQALAVAGVRWNYGDEPIAGNVAVVSKPHGSCNFISQGVQMTAGVTFTTGVVADGPIRPVSPDEALAYCANPNNGLPPAMVAFMEGKPTQVCPSPLSAMQKGYEQAVLNAQKVLVVGVNPHVADKHVWDALAKTPAELAYCGAEVPFDAWKHHHRGPRPSRFLGPYFGPAVPEMVAFLS